MTDEVRCPDCSSVMATEIGERPESVCPNCGKRMVKHIGLFDRNADEAPRVRGLSESADPEVFGGIGRLPYFLLSLIVGVLGGIALYVVVQRWGTGPGEGRLLLAGLYIGAVVVMAIIMAFRLANIGMNIAWGLGMIIPGLNLALIVMCLVAPEGYSSTHRLDTRGRIVLAVFILLILASVAAVTLPVLLE